MGSIIRVVTEKKNGRGLRRYIDEPINNVIINGRECPPIYHILLCVYYILGIRCS